MEVVLSGSQIKKLSHAVHCLAKVAQTAEIAIEAVPSMLMFRTLNAAKTAFLAISFKSDFFDSFQLTAPGGAICYVLVKAVLTVFRTQQTSMERLRISLEGPEASKIRWSIQCAYGVSKTYWLACILDRDIPSAAVDRDSFPSHLVVKPKDLSRLLGNFQSSLGELTLIATEPLSGLDPSGGGGETPEGKAVELKSYVDPTNGTSEGASLHTQLWIDPKEEFLSYVHSGEAADVTFSLKEVKAFTTFCEASDADLKIFFHKPATTAPRAGPSSREATEELPYMPQPQPRSQPQPQFGSQHQPHPRSQPGGDGDQRRNLSAEPRQHGPRSTSSPKGYKEKESPLYETDLPMAPHPPPQQTSKTVNPLTHIDSPETTTDWNVGVNAKNTKRGSTKEVEKAGLEEAMDRHGDSDIDEDFAEPTPPWKLPRSSF